MAWRRARREGSVVGARDGGYRTISFAPFVEGGQLRLLVGFTPTRSPRWPRWPAPHELQPGHRRDVTPWLGVCPRGSPPGMLRTLHDAFKALLFDPAHFAKFDQ